MTSCDDGNVLSLHLGGDHKRYKHKGKTREAMPSKFHHN